MISTTIASSKSIQTRRYYLPIQIPSHIKFKWLTCTKTFYADKQLFDFSGYEKESPFYNDENKNIIGKMKDELIGEIIEEFVGLRAKMYSLKTKKEEMTKAKRVKKNVVKKYISHQDYVDCLHT